MRHITREKRCISMIGVPDDRLIGKAFPAIVYVLRCELNLHYNSERVSFYFPLAALILCRSHIVHLAANFRQSITKLDVERCAPEVEAIIQVGAS